MLKQLARFFADLRVIGFTMALIVILVSVLDYMRLHTAFNALEFSIELFRDIRGNLATIAFTLVVVESITQWRLARLEKRALILQLGSPNSAFANEAARILQTKGWLTDGTLKGLFLAKANWEGGTLWEADLEGAELMEANLRRANLHKANLRAARMWEADLQRAVLMDADLGNANLRQANLSYAEMWRANLEGIKLEYADLNHAVLRSANLKNAFMLRSNLRGAQFVDANLEGVRLVNAELDEETILPDGTSWSADVDMARFTDREHPEFWRPHDVLPDWFVDEQHSITQTA